MSEGLEPPPLYESKLHLENTVIRLLIYGKWDRTKEGNSVSYVPHSHACSELFVCGSGQITLKTETGYLTLNAGDAAIVPPGVNHMKYRTAPDTTGYDISFLCVRKGVWESIDMHKIFLPLISGRKILVYRDQPDLFEDVRQIIRLTESEEQLTPVLMLVPLLLKIVRLPADSDAETETICEETKTVSQFRDMQRMLKLDQMIEKYYAQNWKMEDVAKHLFISPRQLDRITRRRYGKTLYEVIMGKRIQTAEQMLITTDMTVDKIAATVGFSSCAGFYREFSKRYGTTPAEYRKKHL